MDPGIGWKCDDGQGIGLTVRECDLDPVRAVVSGSGDGYSLRLEVGARSETF